MNLKIFQIKIQMKINKNSGPSCGATGVNFTVVKAHQGRSEGGSVRVTKSRSRRVTVSTPGLFSSN